MSQQSFHFKIHGKDAQPAAKELSALIAQQLGHVPQISPEAKREGGITRGVDPVAAVALVLAIPATILAARDLVERLQKKQQVDSLLEHIQPLLQKYKSASIKLEAPDGSTIAIETKSSGRILDKAESQQDKAGESPPKRETLNPGG